MFKAIVLDNIIPKISHRENLDAHTRNWYTSGYRTAYPSTNTCRSDDDCDPLAVCQSGFCASLHRRFDLHGIYADQEYRDLLQQSPWTTLHTIPQTNTSNGSYVDVHGHIYYNVPADLEPVEHPEKKYDYEHAYS